MSTLIRHPPLPLLRRPGRAGSLRQVFGQRAQTLLAVVWAAMERAARHRAAPHLLAQARRVQTDRPELAAALRALAAGH